MATVDVTVVGSISNPTFYIRDSTESTTATNRFVSSSSLGNNVYRLTFNEIKDNTNRTYIVRVTSDTCAQEGSFDLLSPCTGAPTVSLSTDCNSYNPSTNRVFVKVVANLAGATTVKLIITAGNQSYSDGFINVGTENQISVPANTSLSVRVENSTYGNCAYSTTYTAQCAVPCSYSINLSTPRCEGGTTGIMDLTITDSDPGSYQYEILDANGNPVAFTIVFNNIRFNLSSAGNTYTVRVTKASCPPVTSQVTVGCQTGSCSRQNAATYTTRRDTNGNPYSSFTDLCAKYCNNQFSGFTAYFTSTSVGATVYSQNTGCSVVPDGYYAVLNSGGDTFILVRVQNGKITETQPPCNCSNPTLSVNVTTQQPICSNGALVAGTIYLTNGVNAGKYRLCEGNSFTCSNVCADAPVITNGSAVISVPAPAQGTSKNYVIRVYNTNFGCDVYRDYPVTITSPICCVTREVNTSNNSSTTVSYTDCNNQPQTDTISGSNVRKKYCIKEGSLTTSGVATHTLTSNTCDTSNPCALTFSRSGTFCEDNVPKLRYLASGGASDNDYQIRVGNGSFVDFNQGRVHTISGQDNATYNIQIRLKSNNSCIVNDQVTFNTNCTNTGTGCNKPSLSSLTLGVPSVGTAYSSKEQACEEACNNRVVYRNYYSVNTSIGTTVYNSNNSSPNDCSTPPDGWYVGNGALYRIQGGIIVETSGSCFCGEVPTLTPSIISNVQNGQTYTVNVGYNCTTSGVNVYKNGSLFTYLPANTHSFTFTGDQVNNGDVFTAKTVCGGNESGSSNTTTIQKEGTTAPPDTQVCNAQPVSSNGGYNVTTKTLNITFNGTLFYMLSTGGIPDKLTVRKNGIVVQSYLATSWRTAGSISVVAGDQVELIVDGKTTGITGTGWTLYYNCTTPYNVDQNYGGDQDRNNERPTIYRIDADCILSGSTQQRRFIVNANPASATGSPIVQYKLLNNTEGSSDGQFTEAGGWQTSNILTQTIGGNAIQAGKSYTVYVRDQAGKFFGISEVINNAACNPDSNECDKSNIIQYTTARQSNGSVYTSPSEAISQYCAGNKQTFTMFIQGSGVAGSRVFANANSGDCSSVTDGFYVLLDANGNPWKVVGVATGAVYSIQDFGTPCPSNPPSSGNVCNYTDSANGGPEIRTLNFTSNINGKVYFWFNPYTVPDKLTVKRNNTNVFDYPPGGTSGRRYDSVDVSVGDIVTFVIDGTVSGDSTTVWEFRSNCSRPYRGDGTIDYSN